MVSLEVESNILIELVVTQAGVPRSRGVKALKAAKGNIVGDLHWFNL